MSDRGISRDRRRAATPAADSVRRCADAIRSDDAVKTLWEKVDPDWLDVECSIDNLAGHAAGVLNVLPLTPARERFDRARKLQRAIDQFRDAVETYERQSGQYLPPPDPHGDRDLGGYLSELSDFLRDSEGGQWVHPMVITPHGQWPRSPESAVEVWVIRALDSTGIPRNTDDQKDVFLSLAVRLAELIADHCPPEVEVATTRKKIQNHSEFKSRGAFQWRG